MSEGKAAFTPVDDQKVTDGDLDEAAAAAVSDEPKEDTSDSTQNEPTEPTQDTDDDGLPKDHKVRSDLGRKFTALHRRQDEFDQKIDMILDAIAKQQEKPKDPFEDAEAMTRAEAKEYFLKLRDEERQNEIKQKEQYNYDYDNTLLDLTSEYSMEEAEELYKELQNLRYNPTGDGSKDAIANLLKAERIYRRKKTAQPNQKKANLKGDTPPDTITSQKVHVKDAPDVKLSAAGKSYIDFVARMDGPEKAAQLKKSLNA